MPYLNIPVIRAIVVSTRVDYYHQFKPYKYLEKKQRDIQRALENKQENMLGKRKTV